MAMGISYYTQIVKNGGPKTTHDCYDRGRSLSRDVGRIHLTISISGFKISL